MNDVRVVTTLLCAYLVVFVPPTVLEAGGRREANARNFLDASAEEYFPKVPLERFITNEEIASLLSLSDEKKDEELVRKLEFLIIDQEKVFASSSQAYSYEYGKHPIDAFAELANLIRRSPEYVDRIFYLISLMIEKADHTDVFGGIPSFIFLKIFVEKRPIHISSGTLKILYESIPTEKEYLLALYLFATEFKLNFDVQLMYRIYRNINRENHKKLLRKTEFQKYGFIDIENLNYKLNDYYHLRDLIEERLNEMEGSL